MQGVSVYRLADDAGLPTSVVQDFFAGSDPRLSTVGKLLAALGKDLGWLQRQVGT